MKKSIFVFLFSLVFANSGIVFAENTKGKDRENKPDTIFAQFLNEIVVTTSSKETNQLKTLPGSVSVISPLQIDGMRIEDVIDLSATVPNFFIPDYGSKMNAPVYIRGVGNRSSGQASGMYIDNVPLLNKSTYDFDFIDVQRIELLRGPQGTLYGRNAMGGILNVYTPSPLDYQRTKISITNGNYGLMQLKASNHSKLNEKAGLSIGAYADMNDGYFTNEYTGKKADESRSYGNHLKFDYKFSDSFKSSFIVDYDYTKQGAFPYKQYIKEDDIAKPVNYNDEGSYLRHMGLGALNLEYKNKAIVVNSTTSYQLLDDDMMMDQDYTTLSLYNINQKQKQNAFTEEITVKSNTKNNYQWSSGVYGFYNHFKTDVNVNLEEDGIQKMVQPQFDAAAAQGGPKMTVLDSVIPIPASIKTPGYGFAIFHQSTYNNLFFDGLSITAGIRLDYEKVNMDYNTYMGMNLNVQPPGGRPSYNMKPDTMMVGSESLDFIQILPKVALKYEFNRRHYVYASVAKGYNPGGFNIQLLSELAMMSLFNSFNPNGEPVNVKDALAYDPETSWNYELGYKGEIIRNVLSTELALFYIDINDMQLTKFANTGAGRMLTNAGNAVSKGLDFTLNYRVLPELSFSVNYGYTHATFKDYNNGKSDFSGKYLPFTPRQTFSLRGAYVKNLQNSFVDRFNLQAQYNGAGKIFWTEANDIEQDFYGLLNFKAGVSKGLLSLNVWGKNVLDRDYNTFYFESMGNSFLQQGKPATYGVDVVVAF